MAAELAPCTIGRTLNENCHKQSFCKTMGFLQVKSLSVDSREMLEWRCGIAFTNEDVVCYHHEKCYLSYYERLQKYCSDPFQSHPNKITKGLVYVDKDMASRLQLKPGRKLCSKCKRKASCATAGPVVDDQLINCVSDAESDDEFQPQEEMAKSFNVQLESLQCSPLKAGIAENRKVGYGKRKMEQVNTALKTKCANALGISQESLACENCKDLERFVFLLKEKIRVAGTTREKIKLLTLAPESWTQEKTVEEFNVTWSMVKQARTLKNEKGILPEPTPKKARKLSQSTLNRITEFFESDEFSRMCPGKKECITVKNEKGEKITKQKRLLLANIREIYIEFKLKYPVDQVGFSKFCQLRPRWCVTVAAPGSASVCVCEQHQNAKLIVSSLPCHNMDYKELLSKAVCSLTNRDCMLGVCCNCPGQTAVSDFLTELFESNGFELDEEISYKQWGKTNKRCSILTLTSTVEEFISTATDVFERLRQHHFTAKAQAAYLTNLKENLGPEEVVVLLDFAENYSFIVQDAVQGYHWNNSQATLHPFVVYFKKEEGLGCLNLCVVSDCLKHDTMAVHAFITSIMPYLKTTLPQINKVLYFSDGCSGQYKNYKNFLNLCYHQSDYSLNAEWHFFATSHGKSPCDGIGGTVKRLAARASLQATTGNHILSPLEMFDWASKNILGVKFFYVTANDVTSNAVKYDLESRFASGKTVAGTRSRHAYIPIAQNTLGMRKLSADQEFKAVLCS